MEMHLTHVVLLSTRRLPRRLGATVVLDGDDGDEAQPHGDEYRHRRNGRVVVLRVIAQGGGQTLAALWIAANGRNGARTFATDTILAALTEAGRLVVALDVSQRADGRLAVPDVATTPAVPALWPALWRFRRAADGPEWTGGPPPTAQTPGNPPTGEHIVKEALA